MVEIANIKLIATGLIEAARGQEGHQLTLDTIRDAVGKAVAMVPGATMETHGAILIPELERDYHTFVGQVRTLRNDEDGWTPWLAKIKADVRWRFWERYRTFLLQQKNFGKNVVDAIDEITDETLGNLINPSTDGSWDRRGMVVGHVQAGKTTNYAGLICKAADAGYKVIIVLTGFHNNLRTQTQVRLEEAFVGYDITASEGDEVAVAVGVGKVSSDPDLRVDTITNRSESGDFSRSVANNFSINPGGRPLVFVVKKNATILKNLLSYLRFVSNGKSDTGQPVIDGCPLLLIDDEADQGSVDTKKMDIGEGEPDPEHDPTALNGLIRRVLFLFTQSAYVGYTATPFANIFIHNEARSGDYGEDLFPRSFITVMPTPSNYIGPDKVFGLGNEDGESRDPGLPIARPINDYADSLLLDERNGWMPPKHDKMHVPTFDGARSVPNSLKEAIKAFIIGIAVRSLRNQQSEHTSMLIHVTRFVAVQEEVYRQVHDLVRDMQQTLQYGEEGSADALMVEIRDLWESDFVDVTRHIQDPMCPEHRWSEIASEILPAVQSISVRRINGSAADVLDYEQHKATGLNVIAIGGDKLSRGLTLEGLTVSYFTRPSRMYDTLMQMGRWFGYRDGFLDVCRLYAPAKLIEWFEHITDASDELRRAFVLMCEMGETPATWGQRVRSHPTLMVTSQVKMRHSLQLTCSYQGVISETIVFSRKKKDIEKNFTTVKDLLVHIDSLSRRSLAPIRDPENESPGKAIWSGVEVSEILAFLRTYKSTSHVRRVNTAMLANYIEKQVEQKNLRDWSVLLAGKNPDKADSEIVLCGLRTGLISRSVHAIRASTDSEKDPVYRIRRLVSPADESWDLTVEQYDMAKARTAEDANTKPGGEEIRSCRDSSSALLIIYPLKHQPGAGPLAETEACFFGFAISFPGIKHDRPINYRVNQVYQGQFDD